MAQDSTGNFLHLTEISVQPEREDKAIWFLWDVPFLPACSDQVQAEGKEPVVPQVERRQGKTHLLECLSGNFSFTVALPPVSLHKENIEALCTESCAIKLTAYLGEDGTPEADEKIGEAQIPMHHLFAGGKGFETLPVDFDCTEWINKRREAIPASEDDSKQDGSGEEGELLLPTLQLQVCFQKAPALQTLTDGARVLEIGSPILSTLPESTLTTGANVILPASQGEKTIAFQELSGADASDSVGVKKTLIMFQEDITAFASTKSVTVELSIDREGAATLVGSKQLSVDSFWSAPEKTRTVLEFCVSLSEQEEKGEEKDEDVETKEDEEVVQVRLEMAVNPAFIEAKQPPRPFTPEPWDVIERRPGVQRSPPTAKAQFRDSISQVADIVLEEYFIIKEEHKRSVRQKYSPKSSSVQGKLLQSAEGRSVLLLQRLNISDKYRQIHDILLKSIRGLVKDNPGLYGDDRVENCRLEHMYGPIMQLVHRHLNDLAVAAQRRQGEPADAVNIKREKDRLRLLYAKAMDLCTQGNHEAADVLLQERVGISERLALVSSEDVGHVDPAIWTQYGDFCMQRGYDYHQAAAECYRSAIAIDDKVHGALVGYAALLVEADNPSEAMIFVKAALSLESRNASSAHIASGMWIFFTHLKESSLSDLVLLEDAAYYCLRLGLKKFAAGLIACRSDILAQITFDTEGRQHRQVTHMLLGWHAFVSGDWAEAEREFTNALDLNNTCLTSLILLGHSLTCAGATADAVEAYKKALRLFSQNEVPWRLDLSESDTILWFKRLGNMYMSKLDFASARTAFLNWCNFSPSATAWRQVGKCCVELEDFDDAFHALSEANIFDRHDPTVWALLCQTCLVTERYDLAEKCFTHALKNNLEDVELLHALIGTFVDAGRKQFLLKCDINKDELSPKAIS